MFWILWYDSVIVRRCFNLIICIYFGVDNMHVLGTLDADNMHFFWEPEILIICMFWEHEILILYYACFGPCGMIV